MHHDVEQSMGPVARAVNRLGTAMVAVAGVSLAWQWLYPSPPQSPLQTHPPPPQQPPVPRGRGGDFGGV